MDYKIEKKPNYWMITRWRGAYSDYEEKVDVVAANSPEEAWLFITAYWKDLFEKGGADVETAEWGTLRVNFTEKEDCPFWGWICKIEMLPVLHVHSLK